MQWTYEGKSCCLTARKCAQTLQLVRSFPCLVQNTLFSLIGYIWRAILIAQVFLKLHMNQRVQWVRNHSNNILWIKLMCFLCVYILLFSICLKIGRICGHDHADANYDGMNCTRTTCEICLWTNESHMSNGRTARPVTEADKRGWYE